MHIKTVVFGGFLSYKEGGLVKLDGTKGEEFSPMVNMVVGRNGSGKSNFFAAVQFVLGQGKYKVIPTKDRKELLHEGAGNKVWSAFVELHLDNSDGGLALESEASTIVIRRMLGTKKDEYRVNNRSTTAAEVHSMLESAGFSPSNPYNIVEQGKVIALATMKDTLRFNVLKEVAGTHVYEDRLQQGMKLLGQAEVDMGTVATNINTIETRLEELGEEREEFKVHQSTQQTLKCLQYCLHKAELDKASKLLKEHDSGLSGQDDAVQKAYTKMQDMTQSIKQLERSAATSNVTHQQLKRQKEILLQERNGWLRRHAKAQVALESMETDRKDALDSKSRLEKNLETVQKEVTTKQASLAEKEAELHTADVQVAKSQGDLSGLSSRVEQLITKKGRHNQFSTRAERDKYLAAEVKKQQKVLQNGEEQLEALEAKAKVIPQEIEKAQKVAKQKRSTVSKGGGEKSAEKISTLTKERDALHERRRALFRDQAGLQQQLDTMREKEQEWRAKLNKTIPRDIRLGIQSVEEVLRQNPSIEGVHGPVVSLFSTDKELFTACDVMAGTSLFHIVVETNEVASKILKVINEKKLPGRPSFYPLNRLNSRAKDLPTTEDCFPLFSRLHFDAKFKPVLADLYGRVLVCTNLQSASGHSKTYNCDCVLPNGDKVDARGGISGGFMDAKISRIATSVEARKVKGGMGEIREKLDGARQEQADIDQKVTTQMNALRQAQEDHAKIDRSKEKEILDIRAIERDIQQLHEAKSNVAKRAEEQKSFLKDTEASMKANEDEMKTPMTDKLSKEEAMELQTKQNLLDEAQKKHGHIAAQADGIRAGVTQLRQNLDENLLKREDDLKQRLAQLAASGNSTSGHQGQQANVHEAAAVKKRVDDIEQDLKELSKKIDESLSTRSTLSAKADAERTTLEKLKKQTHKDRTVHDDKKRARMTHFNKYEAASEQIRKLMPLPANVSKFESLPAKQVEKQIGETRSKLKGLTKVNKKAFDQYTTLAETLEGLVRDQKKRRNDLETLQQLIEDCNAKKDEAVLRTFKQVKVGFEKNFKDLVGHQGAKAELVLQRAEVGDKKKATRVDEFNAVAVKVDFGVGGGVGEKSLERLSGGQKSLVALAFIFAIQQCDPAPFYLFDEIDAALDDDYRANVARKIQELSKSAQFLIISFKKGMLDIGNKHYQIKFENKVSRVSRCTLEGAQRVLAMSAKRPRTDPAATAADVAADDEIDMEQPTQQI